MLNFKGEFGILLSLYFLIVIATNLSGLLVHLTYNLLTNLTSQDTSSLANFRLCS